MQKKLSLSSICSHSDELIAREVGGEILLIPLKSGLVDGDEALYSLSPIAKEIWELLDGINTIGNVVDILSQSYDASFEEIKKDVLGFVSEMIQRKMIVSIDS